MSGRTRVTKFVTLFVMLAVYALHLNASYHSGDRATEVSTKARAGIVVLNDTSSFSKSIEDYCQMLHLPALAVGVALGDSLIFFKGMGIASSLTKEVITGDHIFPIASVTKTFTAVALKQMEGEGKLRLDDPVSKYRNQYFTTNRWNEQTTLAHLVSGTSESRPQGTQFVYNGSKFNIVFNAFCAINKTNVPDDMTRPFTEEIQKRILTPLKMEHTLLRFSEGEHGHLKKWIVQTSHLNEADGKFTSVDVDPAKMQSGPGFGMMSSVNDLVKYSAALNRSELLTTLQYRQLTSPFYPGSPYGEGWFTTSFEGTDMQWAYGYGDNDAALLLRIPSKDLTLIMLSPCALPSAGTRLGYGNPFNAMLVCSFFRNFIQRGPDDSRLPIEEKFAKATTLSFMPASLHPDTLEAGNILQALIKEFPSDKIWQTPTAFELVSASGNPRILEFGESMANQFLKSEKSHPAKAWYAGVIYQKNGKPEKAADCFEWLANGDQFCEQIYKFNAMMELAKWYRNTNAQHAREIIQNLIRFKEYINADDMQYKEAKRMLAQLK